MSTGPAYDEDKLWMTIEVVRTVPMSMVWEMVRQDAEAEADRHGHEIVEEIGHYRWRETINTFFLTIGYRTRRKS